MLRITTLRICLLVLKLAIARDAAAESSFLVKRCAPDSVAAGTVCLDKYEASAWRVPSPATANAQLVRRIQLGVATPADLSAGGATQLGVARDDYDPCRDTGQDCEDEIYAVSLAGASTTELGPGALLRGGSFVVSGSAGPLRVIDVRPSFSSRFFGFRCAR